MVMLPSSMNGSVSATLPLLQQSADTYNPSLINGDIGGGRLATADGPTVRQHLQQQQAAQRHRQQHEAMVRRLCQQQQREETTGAWTATGGGLAPEKLQQQQQQQMNTQRRRPQIESAPASVTANFGAHGGPSPCSFPPSVPSSSSAVCAAAAELQPHIMLVSTATPLPPSATKTFSADSLSSPSKRGGRSRAAIGRTKAAANATAANLASTHMSSANASLSSTSSADTLANTIASVASGGGSFEFEKAIGTSPLPSSLSMSAGGGLTAPAGGGDPSAVLLASTGAGAVPSTSAQPQQLTASPGVKRRRTQQMKVAVAAIVNALEQPPMGMDQLTPAQPANHVPVAAGSSYVGDPSLSHHPLQQPQQHSSLGMGPASQHEQIIAPSQCRIHVQNPPQTHGDFPPTGTKIQVVHMQPPAAAVSHHHLNTHNQPMTPVLSDNVSPQQQIAASRSVSARLSSLRSDHHLSASPASIPYDFHAPATANNSCSSDGGGMIHQNGFADLSSSSTEQQQLVVRHQPHHSSSRKTAAVAAGAPPGTPYSPYQHHQHYHFPSQQQQLPTASFVSPSPQTQQQHFYGNPMQQQMSPPSTSYQYNQQPQQLQHQQQNLHPPGTGFKHLPPQPAHGHFSPSNNMLVTNHTNGRPPPYRPFPQHYMTMDGCSPIPPTQQSPLMSGEHFPAQSPAPPHPSTSSSPSTAVAIMPTHGQHQQQVPPPPLHHQQQDMATSSPIATLQCTPPNSGGSFPQQQHHFTLPTAPPPAHHMQQSQPYHQLQRHQLQQHQTHPLSGGCPTTPANFQQAIMVSPQNLPPSQPSASLHVQSASSHQRFGTVLSPTPPPSSAYPSSGAIVASKLPPSYFRNVAPPSPFVCPAPPAPGVVLSQPPSMGSPLPQRAQLSRAQLLSRHSRDVESRKFAVKLYHLQRTIKALVYKNGALADELARLNQRIYTVTAERKMLAKRLQHHERNRIRRIQSQYRKAIAAANNHKQQQQQATSANPTG